MTLHELHNKVSKNKDLTTALGRVDPAVIDYYTHVLKLTFPHVFKAEHEPDPNRFQLLKAIYFRTAAAAMNYLDVTGVTAAIGKSVADLKNFSYRKNIPNLAFDHDFLVRHLGVPESKVLKFWEAVDIRKTVAIRLMQQPGFKLESLVAGAEQTFDSTGGPDWEHLSPGFWTRMAGFALGCANVGLAVGSVGIGTPVAVASVAAGAAAVAAG